MSVSAAVFPALGINGTVNDPSVESMMAVLEYESTPTGHEGKAQQPPSYGGTHQLTKQVK